MEKEGPSLPHSAHNLMHIEKHFFFSLTFNEREREYEKEEKEGEKIGKKVR